MASDSQRRAARTTRQAGVSGVRPSALEGAASRIDADSEIGENQAMGKSVLIVDDHPSFRASARRMLEAEGYEVVGEAEDGAAALSAVGQLHPDLVLLDVGLPDVDGFEVARRLLGVEGRTPQIVLTSSNDPTDLGEEIGTSGARGFIPKGELTCTAVAALLR
jgi:DNA-binding NarL/FixJ family response regulator